MFNVWVGGVEEVFYKVQEFVNEGDLCFVVILLNYVVFVQL